MRTRDPRPNRAVFTHLAPVTSAEEALESELEDSSSFVVDQVHSSDDDAPGIEPRALVKWVG